MQQILPQSDAPAVTLPRRSDSIPSHAPDSCDLQQLGERLRLTYGPVEAPLSARLAELVERLARRERLEDYWAAKAHPIAVFYFIQKGTG